jgi:hypothetical protein
MPDAPGLCGTSWRGVRLSNSWYSTTGTFTPTASQRKRPTPAETWRVVMLETVLARISPLAGSRIRRGW